MRQGRRVAVLAQSQRVVQTEVLILPASSLNALRRRKHLDLNRRLFTREYLQKIDVWQPSQIYFVFFMVLFGNKWVMLYICGIFVTCVLSALLTILASLAS